MWLNVIQVLGTISGDTIAHMYQTITKKLSGQNWKSHPSMVLGILSQIYLEKISAVCHPVQLTSTSPEPKTKNHDCRELSEKSWFLVSCFHGCTGIYRPLTVWMFFWPMCRCVIRVFSVGIIDVHGFSYLCFCHFLNSHGRCNTVLWWDVFVAWVLSWFYFFKEVRFSDKERSFQSKVHYSFQKLKMLVTEVSVLF